MGTGGLCLQQYHYCSGMADDLSSANAITASWLSVSQQATPQNKLRFQIMEMMA